MRVCAWLRKMNDNTLPSGWLFSESDFVTRVAIGLGVVWHGLALAAALHLELCGSPDSIGKAFEAGLALGVRAHFKLEPARAQEAVPELDADLGVVEALAGGIGDDKIR